MLSPEQRFSDRVENYVRYRPHYPAEVISWFTEHAGLTANSCIADIGSGTGISTELFLKAGCNVWAVEPNQEMRAAAEFALSSNVKFHSVAGTAQAHCRMPPWTSSWRHRHFIGSTLPRHAGSSPES